MNENKGAIIYNVTIQVDKTIADDWLTWLKNDHIPEIMRTGCFKEYRIVRLLEVDESEGSTYAVQYTAESKADYNRYVELFSVELRKKGNDKWGNGFIAFRSVMEVIH